MIHEMYGSQCMMLKEIHMIFVSMILCSIADNLNHHIPEGKKTIAVY